MMKILSEASRQKWLQFMFAMLILSTNVNAQTPNDAVKFLKDNSALAEITCTRARVLNGKGTEFNPRAVKGVSAYRNSSSPIYNLECISGDCMRETKYSCNRPEENNQCRNQVFGWLDSDRNVEKTNFISQFDLDLKVDSDRFNKAWDFFVQSCGGQKGSFF